MRGLSLRAAASSPGSASVTRGQAVRDWQTLISAGAVGAASCGPPGGKPGRALVLRSRCRQRSTWTRRRARPARMASRFALMRAAGRLAVAAPHPGGGDDGPAGGGERDLAGVHRLPGATAAAGGDGDSCGGAGEGVGQLDGDHPGGVLLGDQGRRAGAEHRPGGRPGAADRRLGLLQAGFRADPPPVVGLRELAGRVGRMIVQGWVGPGALPGFSRWVPPARPPHPACTSRRNGRSTCLGRWSAAVRLPVRGSMGSGCGAAVAVAGHRDAGCAGEDDPVVGEPPSWSQKRRRSSFIPSRCFPVYLRVSSASADARWWSTALNVALETPYRK